MNKSISVIGVASDLGANIAGSRLGPDAIRVAGLHRILQTLGYTTNDQGNLIAPLRLYGQDGSSNYLQEIAKLNKQLKEACTQAFTNGQCPLILGGDHSLAIGSIAATLNHYKDVGLIWVDTHADLNNPSSSETQNIHGMPVSTLLHNSFKELVQLVNVPLRPENVVMIGLRDIDQEEKEILTQSGIHYFTMRHVDELGIQGVFRAAQQLLIDKVSALHVSFDMDVMDPLQVPGVSTPVNGGLNIREAHLLLELLHESDKVVSCDFVELNPMHDVKGQSAQVALDLIGSLFGTSII